jgi:bifunctional non-homologous end joining protein LigD
VIDARSLTDRLPGLRSLPDGLTLDGEVVAWVRTSSRASRTYAPRSSTGPGDRSAITCYVFDVLRVDGESTMALPFVERRKRLEALDLAGPACPLSGLFDDGEALFWPGATAASRASSRYGSATRTVRASGTASRRRPEYWRYPLEVAAMASKGSASAR